MMCPMDHKQEPQHKECHEVKQRDFNFATIFKSAEILPTPNRGHLATRFHREVRSQHHNFHRVTQCYCSESASHAVPLLDFYADVNNDVMMYTNNNDVK